jgi:hypothetical protein
LSLADGRTAIAFSNSSLMESMPVVAMYGEWQDTRNQGKHWLSGFTVTQAAQEPRRQELSAEMLDDPWRFSCEMPDAPHLSKR